MMVLALALTGCVTLDSFLYNPVHCSEVGPATCEDIEEPLDRICVPCDEPYDWGREHPWPPGTLEEGQTIRPIPEAAIRELPIASADGEATLDAYFIESHGEDADLASITLVYNHGRYGGIEHYQPRIRYLYEAGYNVLVWDFRGFGKSDPPELPTSAQQLADARTVMARALEEAPDPQRVVSYAYSAGTMPGTEMLTLGPCGLILEAPVANLASLQEFGTRLSLGEQFLSTGLIDSVPRVAAYDGPVFAMIGTEDEFVSGIDTTRELAEAGSGPAEVWVVDGARHGLAPTGIPEEGLNTYLAEVRDFVTTSCL